MTPQEFYAQYMPFAQEVSNRTGLDPRLVLAQAALETGYGKSAPGGNFFGIKSHGRNGGNTLQTKEYQGGQMVSQPASFRAYDGAGQSFDDYAGFIKSNPRYKDVLAAGDLEGQIEAMGKSGYATDPRYAAKLRNIAAKFDPSSPDTIAADTMTALGRGPRGILAPTEPEAQPMIAEQQPKGLLASLGIQKMQPGAEGETGQRFYERDTFKDTAARMAQGFAALGGNPAMQRFAADVAAQRTEGKARNKTVEYLRKAGRTDLAGMVDQGLLRAGDAAQILTGKGNVQSSQALPDQSGVVMTMRDGSIAVKTVGGETLQGQQAMDFVKQSNERYAGQQREIYGARAIGKGEGQRKVDEAIDVTERQRNIGSLRVVVDQLNALSDTATYTLLGQASNEIKKQLGLPASEGAIARSEYIAVVDNQILPLLRETFGAAFTVKEGETLRATLGDPNKTPAEKKVVLDAFIAQKERDLQARTGQGVSPADTPFNQMDVLQIQKWMQQNPKRTADEVAALTARLNELKGQ